MCVGLFVGIVHFAVELAYSDKCEEGGGTELTLTASNWFQCINFMYFTMLLFTLVVGVTLGVSYYTKPPKKE